MSNIVYSISLQQEDDTYRDVAVRFAPDGDFNHGVYRTFVSLDKESRTNYQGDWTFSPDATTEYGELEGDPPPEILAAFEQVKAEAYKLLSQSEPAPEPDPEVPLQQRMLDSLKLMTALAWIKYGTFDADIKKEIERAERVIADASVKQ